MFVNDQLFFTSLLPGKIDLRICLVIYCIIYLILAHVSMQRILLSHCVDGSALRSSLGDPKQLSVNVLFQSFPCGIHTQIVSNRNMYIYSNVYISCT